MNEKTLAERIETLRADAEASRSPSPTHELVTWRTATEADIDAMHAVAAAADAVDHPTWITPREDIADTFDLPHIDHARDTILAVDAAGEVVGFGSSFLHPAREGALTVNLGGTVRPDLRRRGIGTAILAWQRARAIAQLADALAVVPKRDGGWTADIKSYAEEANVDARAIAERQGFAPERWFTTMERDMSAPVADVPTPEGVTIVPFTHDRDDDTRLARNDAFRDHWGSQPSQPETWRKFIGGRFFRSDLSRLALDADGGMVGFCLASVNEEDWVALGATNSYIDLIGVVRSHRRRGIAPAVVAGTLGAIAAAGLERAVLDVDTASPTGANTLYEGLGFHATERMVALVTTV